MQQKLKGFIGQVPVGTRPWHEVLSCTFDYMGDSFDIFQDFWRQKKDGPRVKKLLGLTNPDGLSMLAGTALRTAEGMTEDYQLRWLVKPPRVR